MNIPNKLSYGMQFKPSVVKTINGIIDYLYTQRITGDNKYISVTQNSTGVSIKGVKRDDNLVNESATVEMPTPIIFNAYGGNSVDGFSGTYIKNGVEYSAQNIFFIPSLNQNEEIFNRWVVGFETQTPLVGGND